MDLDNVSSQDLLKAVFKRFGKNSGVEICFGGVIQFAYYSQHINGPIYRISAESYDYWDFSNEDEAVNEFIVFLRRPHKQWVSIVILTKHPDFCKDCLVGAVELIQDLSHHEMTYCNSLNTEKALSLFKAQNIIDKIN